MAFEYVRDYYQVPAEIGRIVTVNGKRGIIAADRGQYIGVNFDDHKPGTISLAHPTWKVVYGEIGVVRKVKRSQYGAYLDADYGHSFAEWLRIELPRYERAAPYHEQYQGAPKDGYRMVRDEHVRGRWRQEVKGEWKPTMKEAKESYKEALTRVLADERKLRREYEC